jgi:cyclopentanol dehydrogenase
MKRLEHKVVIVTGAAGGIGAATAKLLAAEGAGVIATDQQEEKLKQWVHEARAEGAKIDYVSHDITSEEGWKKVISRVSAQYGRLDILVNNAGIFPGFTDLEQTTHSEWEKVIRVNLTGPFLGCRAALQLMKESGGGSIINIASIAGIVGGNGPAYSASKGGLRLLTKDLAVNLAKYNIRVNSICPGAVLTPMTENLVSDPEIEKVIKTSSPQGRIANPVEIANGVLYLATNESSFATGIDLVIDGGSVAR